ncbi:sulfurtransferase TusA family protein [Actinomadura viridis]|uniref:sulfurtransferase TusA family protein n=1 Tax=Actinomadura viridis TaxID=58110 RepID=UPI00369BCA1E
MRFRGRTRSGTRRGAAGEAPAQAVPEPAWPTPVLVIDALGRKCPIPIILLAERIREIPVGEVVAVLADDVAARTDVPAWCRMKSQEFVREETLLHAQAPADAPPRGWAFHIRRMY